jgi:hypothetical protein
MIGKVIQIAGADGKLYALTEDGKVYCRVTKCRYPNPGGAGSGGGHSGGAPNPTGYYTCWVELLEENELPL